MMLTAGEPNPIKFRNKDIGIYPNSDNTMHCDLKQAGHTVIKYYQPFDKGFVVYLQFVSDDNVVPELEAFGTGETTIIAGTLASSYEGLINRYFFNFIVILDTKFYDKIVYFECRKGGIILTSEPIKVYDMSIEIATGKAKHIQVSNYDRYVSDLNNRYIDWSVIPNTAKSMGFFIHGVTRKPNSQDESELLTDSESNTIISAQYFKGIIFETGTIPLYMADRLAIVSMMDFFAINDKQYIKQGSISQDIVGGSTSVACKLSISDKIVSGINTDDIGIESVDEMKYFEHRSFDNVTTGFSVVIPKGYMLHTILCRHKPNSTGLAFITAGYSFGSEYLIDSMAGRYEDDGNTKRFMLHDRANFDGSSTLFVGVSGSGSVLRFEIDFTLNE